MRIEIKDNEDTLTLTDDMLDNDLFVDVLITNSEGEDFRITVSLHDLMPAVIAFDAKRNKRLSEENPQ